MSEEAEIVHTEEEAVVEDEAVVKEDAIVEEGDEEEVVEEAKPAVEADAEVEPEEPTNPVRIDWVSLSFDEVLKQKIKINDGSEQFMFSRGPKYSDEFWPINCHVCRQGALFSETELRAHVKHRRHQVREHGRLLDAKIYLEPFYQSFTKQVENETPIKIFPGEFITSLTEEYADRIVKKEDFEGKLPSEEKIKLLESDTMYEYNQKLPLIGLCYMYKMDGFKGISYFCLLCNEKIKGEAYCHVVDSDHQAKYILRHFPNTYEKVLDELRPARNINLQYCMRNIFRKLYRKIENVKGFKKLTLVDDDDFYANRKRYMLKTRFDEHYDEDTVIITDKEVDVLIRKCISGAQFIKPDLISLANPRVGMRDENHAGRGRLPVRTFGNEQRWFKYFDRIEKELAELNQTYRRYDRYPKMHPKYEVEFKKFKTFKNEPSNRLGWNVFWTRRLRVLYELDMSRIKAQTKKNLGLRMDHRSPSPPRRPGGGGGGGQGGPPNQPNMDYPNHLRDVLAMNLQKIQHQMRMQEQQQAPPPPMEYQMPQEALGVISVLRLYTALEGQLGSQGPQAMKMLTRAVLAEKKNENPNDLMLEEEFYLMFVAVKEKLKGQLAGSLVDRNLVRAVQKAISDTETLVDMFDDYMRRTNKRLKPANDGDSFQQNRGGQNNGNNYSNDQNSYGNSGNGGNGGGNGYGNSGKNFSNSTNTYSGGSGGGNNYNSGSGPSGGNNYNSGSGPSGGNNYNSGSTPRLSGGNNYSSGLSKSTYNSNSYPSSNNYTTNLSGLGGGNTSFKSSSLGQNYRSNFDSKFQSNSSSQPSWMQGNNQSQISNTNRSNLNNSNNGSYDPSFYTDSYNNMGLSFKNDGNSGIGDMRRNNY